MGRNDSHETRLTELGRAYAVALPSGDEVGVCRRVSDAVEAVDALVKRAGLN
jgi:hypothetical protein